ncbi:hypothetical protein JdFRA1000001_31c [uncultured archaeal virus]|uniref:Uncharacterized protein n=1 Tax=uncultured archaeal virus TaxID=1960247 RepID=A0A1S5Y2Y3_9VIRU|nr:hypothetical protein JdFRA1000001_31c [uncultured archaeal virus]
MEPEIYKKYEQSKNTLDFWTKFGLNNITKKLKPQDVHILSLIDEGFVPAMIVKIFPDLKKSTVYYRLNKLIKLGLVVREYDPAHATHVYRVTLKGKSILDIYKTHTGVQKIDGGSAGGVGVVVGIHHFGVRFELDGPVDRACVPGFFVEFQEGKWRARVDGLSVLVYKGGSMVVYGPSVRGDVDPQVLRDSLLIATYKVGEAVARSLGRRIVGWRVFKPHFEVEDPWARDIYRDVGVVKGDKFSIDDSHNRGARLEFKDISAVVYYRMLPEILARFSQDMNMLLQRIQVLEENQVKIVKSLNDLSTGLEKIVKIFEKMMDLEPQENEDRSSGGEVFYA